MVYITKMYLLTSINCLKSFKKEKVLVVLATFN